MTTYTSIPDTEGFGSVYVNIMSGIAYANYNNYIFIPTAINKIAHRQNTEKMNKFIGFDKYYSPKRIDICEKRSTEVLHDKNTDKWWTKNTIKKIRNYYYTEKKPSKCPYDIAIHIRRGDVKKTTQFKSWYTCSENYETIIKMLKKKYPSFSICIYSEGNLNDFKSLHGPNISFKLNTCLEETFHHFVTAKIFVTAKSNLSYAAAILSENTIYCIPIRNRSYPLSHWNILDYKN